MNMQEVTFSIIVPIYNAEKWLQDAVDSVMSQSVSDWELILVDDGSTDTSKNVVENLVASNPRIKAIFNENHGVSAARNQGLQAAKGKYIIFLDADDMLAENALSIYLDIIAKHPETEIIKTSHNVKNHDNLFETRFAKERIGCEDKMLDGALFLEKVAWYHCVIYAYCYKASLLKDNKLQFLEEVSYLEDGAFIVTALRKAKHCYYSPECTYVYRYQESLESLSNSVSTKKAEGVFKVLVSFKKDLAASDSAAFKHYVNMMLSMHGYYLVRMIMKIPRSERKGMFKQMHDIVGDLPLGKDKTNKIVLFIYNNLTPLLSIA